MWCFVCQMIRRSLKCPLLVPPNYLPQQKRKISFHADTRRPMVARPDDVLNRPRLLRQHYCYVLCSNIQNVVVSFYLHGQTDYSFTFFSQTFYICTITIIITDISRRRTSIIWNDKDATYLVTIVGHYPARYQESTKRYLYNSVTKNAKELLMVFVQD